MMPAYRTAWPPKPTEATVTSVPSSDDQWRAILSRREAVGPVFSPLVTVPDTGPQSVREIHWWLACGCPFSLTVHRP